ncbi:efflux RND transporter periplasmic adaptor subunit [Thalassomonas viridans]|uniref:Efflux RND transporter periplasmic adaptor subunit n=1 Tax=Thalassomonas viridans TaxID=137584 RepID=A0AAE9Z5L0_9GAMM|nr:efflux RND transporter periplasmic adaptor subunit [Thalassomonas viridans]WDE06697.1 efflux RND transporter periplasmic adaptor subunit [Thalassomonas viridans]
MSKQKNPGKNSAVPARVSRLTNYLLCIALSCAAFSSASAQQGKNQPVRAVEVKTGTVYDWAFSEGVAQGIRREYLSFEKGGKITFIASDQQNIPLRAGSRVYGPKAGEKFGQLLARVDERADIESVREFEAALNAARLRIDQADSQLKQVKNNLQLAQSSFTRNESIWKKKLIPKEQYDASRTELLNAKESLTTAKAELATAKSQEKSALAQLNQAKVALEKTSIFAPFDGVLRKVNVRQGDYWGGPAGATSDREREASSAMVVVDTSQYEVTLNVPYYAGDKLQENQAVFLSWSSAKLLSAAKNHFSDNSVSQGHVYSVSPSINLEQRAIEVKVHTRSGAGLLKDGMHVTAWIMVDKKEDVTLVPNNAIVTRNNKPFVYRVTDQGQAELVAVQTGIEDLNQVEITDGLSPGMQVITEGKHKVVNGTKVRLVQESVHE